MLKLLFACCIIGLLGLEAIALIQEPKQIEIKEITKQLKGKEVKINAVLINLKIAKENSFFDLIDDSNKTLKGVFFNKKLDLNLNYKKVEVKGKIGEYKKKLEIIASEINQIN